MNSHSQWRLSLAERVGVAYAANPKVAAVMVGGSTARGHADRFSDIELGVYWPEAPARADQAGAVEAARPGPGQLQDCPGQFPGAL